MFTILFFAICFIIGIVFMSKVGLFVFLYSPKAFIIIMIVIVVMVIRKAIKFPTKK